MSALDVSGPDGVRYLAMLVNHEAQGAWFVGPARRIVTDIGGPAWSRWCAIGMMLLAGLLVVFACIAATTGMLAVPFRAGWILLGAGILAATSGVVSFIGTYGAARELKAAVMRIGDRMLGRAPLAPDDLPGSSRPPA